MRRDDSSPIGLNGGCPSRRRLLSGFLQCSECGGSFFDLYRGRWGCSYRFRRKTCDNALVIPGAALEEAVLTAVREAIDEQVAERALEVALEELRRRAQSSEPSRIEAELATVDAKIERVLDALVDLDSDAPAVKERLQGLQAERVRLTGELARSRATLPSVEELRPLLREKLADLRATLGASPQGRMALGALLDGKRLIVHPDGRIEGLLKLGDQTLCAPRSEAPGRRESVVAGARFARVCRLPVPLELPVVGRVAA